MAHALCHVAQVHVFVVNLFEVDVVAEVGIGREGCPELDGMGVGHVALHALARRGSGEDAYGKGVAGLVLTDGTLRQFAEDGLGVAIGGKSGQGEIVAVLNHRRRFGSSYM